MQAQEQIPMAELAVRHAACSRFLPLVAPQASGFLLCSRVHIYYLTGTLGWGLLWLPLEGAPLLLLRKGLARAAKESPVQAVGFTSYKEIASLCAEWGSPLGAVLAVDKNAFSWSMAEMLQSRVTERTFVAADAVLAQARAIKTPWERAKMRLAGAAHAQLLDELLPARLHAGMTEMEIARCYSQEALALGSSGLIRMQATGEENYWGYVSAGESSLYPTYYNGPLGCLGKHPAVPFMGSEKAWAAQSLLALDLGYTYEGYHTDRTQCYWSGAAHSVPQALRRAQDVCIEILQSTVAQLKAGAIPAQLWQQACALAAARGFEGCFMGMGRDAVPFLGHGIGLAMDEWPVLARSFSQPLQVGMVLAIEPKISVAGQGMAGVEHSFEITEQGAQSLTGSQYDFHYILD